MIIEDLQPHLDEADQEMDLSVDFLKREFKQIRAGKASPALLEGVKVDYYGSPTPLNQVANVSAPEPRMLLIQPWEKAMIQPIEKAIQTSNLGLNPQNDGNLIRIPLPVLTEERRQELVKLARETAEKARVSIRNARRDANDNIKKEVKNNSLPEDSKFAAEEEVQKLTDTYSEKVEKMLKEKEDEILSI